MRLGLISDTHGLLRPEVLPALRGVDHILHAGDVGSASVLDALRTLAPVHAVRGNNDRDPWGRSLPAAEWIELRGHTLYLLHDLADLDFEAAASGVSFVVHGHSHRPSDQRRRGVRCLNPGSAGPRRWSLPITVATLDFEREPPQFDVHHLLSPAQVE